MHRHHAAQRAPPSRRNRTTSCRCGRFTRDVRSCSPNFATDHHEELLDSPLPGSEREMFARAMTAAQPAARADFMARFGVEWLDPTGDRKLLERLLTFPLHVFRVGNRPRGLARELGRGLIPESVRLRRNRSVHFPDEDCVVHFAGGRLSTRIAIAARILHLWFLPRPAGPAVLAANTVRRTRLGGRGADSASRPGCGPVCSRLRVRSRAAAG